MWLWWVLGGLIAWTGIAFFVAVVLGRGIRLADLREIKRDASLTATDLPADAPATVAAPRLRVSLPPLGIALAAAAVALETVGFVLRQTGHESQLLSMDAVYSLPRLYVAALFAAAALAAVAGAGVLPARRTWWTAIGLVAGLIAAVKAGSTLHADALHWLVQTVGFVPATLLSAALAAVIVTALWMLSHGDRRDRRRVLGSLAAYGMAAVGLSAVSAAVGPDWSTVATYVEESGEALAGVAFLVAVLVGVAPRVVLPASWRLRRAVDAQTLDLPERLPGRATSEDVAR
jgi:hypothetical protein